MSKTKSNNRNEQKKKNDPVEPMEELTDAMHATFTINDEKDKKYRVWSAMDLNEERDYSLEKALELQLVTWADNEKYKNTRLNG